ncbi:MAG: SDR family oxidoreductase [Clostridiales bacterium]|nr:SDR family oxidoreductase [Clostridiales bacterium]
MKKILITGGATGIGKACAKLFCEKGFDIFITKNETEPDFDGVTAIKCNLENVDEIESLFRKIGDIDVLVNNAGVSLIKQINDTEQDEYDALMYINARSYFFCAKEAAKNMLRRHSGSIVNISSICGQTGASCEVAYSMSKAAVIGLTKALAQELAPSNITVNCVCPGITDTRMNNMFDKKELEAEVPLGRLAEPEEIADAVFFLAQNRYITGQILGVNGGMV